MTNTINDTVSNSDVVRLRGRARVMRQAWFLFKSVGVATFSLALKKAWSNLRASVTVDMSLAGVADAVAKSNATARLNGLKALAKRKASYTGDRNSLSPLNPFRAKNDLIGKDGRAYVAAVLGR